MTDQRTDPPCREGEISELEITDLNHRGEGVGKKNGFTIFVPGALPCEKVEIKITAVHRNYAEATLLSLISTAEQRISPPCPYFKHCGGCQLQHLDYKKQLAWKREMVTETLHRIAAIEVPVLPIIGMDEPWRFRNKAQIHLGFDSGRVIAGFFEEKSHRIIDIEDCLVQHPLIAQMINHIRTSGQKFIDMKSGKNRNPLPVTGAVIRSSFSTNRCLVTLPGKVNSSPGSLEKLANLISGEAGHLLSGVTLLQPGNKGLNIKHHSLFGQAFLEEEITPYRYRISPKSFFQVNPRQAAVLYKEAAKLAGSPRTAYDLYCGTGNFALYLSRKAGTVLGIDSESSAIDDAKANAILNNIDNVKFINGRAEEISGLLLKGEHPITLYLNPPRGGCSPDLLESAAAAKPERIIYISCNPSTLARDLKQLLQKQFKIRQVQPIDMFPHTSHVETITLIEHTPN